jgi:hypothetical protein
LVTKTSNGVALLACLALLVAPARATTKVFLLAGQSNMVGAGGAGEGDPPIPAPYNVAQPDVQISWMNGGWAALQQGFSYEYNSFGPEVSFGYRLHNTLFPADSIYLVKYAVGGTHLATEYSEWNPNGGTLYNGLKTAVNNAMQNLTAAGKAPQIAGMIWMQGESDANNATYAAEYATNLTNFIVSIRHDLNVPNMPFVVGRITTHYDTSPPSGAAIVRAAEMTVPGQVGHASWIDTDDLEQNPAQPWHYGTQGQIDLGIRFANAIAAIPEPSTLTMAGTLIPASSCLFVFPRYRHCLRRVVVRMARCQ